MIVLEYWWQLKRRLFSPKIRICKISFMIASGLVLMNLCYLGGEGADRSNQPWWAKGTPCWKEKFLNVACPLSCFYQRPCRSYTNIYYWHFHFTSSQPTGKPPTFAGCSSIGTTTNELWTHSCQDTLHVSSLASSTLCLSNLNTTAHLAATVYRWILNWPLPQFPCSSQSHCHHPTARNCWCFSLLLCCHPHYIVALGTFGSAQSKHTQATAQTTTQLLN